MNEEQLKLLAKHVLYQDCAIAEIIDMLDDMVGTGHMSDLVRALLKSHTQIKETFGIELEVETNERH